MVSHAVRAMVAVLLLALGLSLSSCVVYEEPYGGGHWHDHDRWR